MQDPIQIFENYLRTKNLKHSKPKYPDGSSEPFSRECAMIYQGISVAKMCQNIWSGT